jgi:NADP-dependent 3-hydroxy acid dehydrogenase YdfG
MSIPKVWFVTGSSSGFGLQLTHELLESGYRVAATLRKPERLAHLEAKYPDTLLVAEVDVTKPDQTRSAVAATVAKWGRIDVLANNAGYGLVGMVEDAPMDQVRDIFETNVFGALETLRAVMPVMREQRSGVILNLSSIVGLVAYRGNAFYAATKHALEAISESLSLETVQWGIKVVSVEPGPYRTEFAAGSLKWGSERMPAYGPVYEAVDKIYNGMNGTQAGDPVKAVKLMIEVAESENPPLRLPMGKFAYEETELYIEAIITDREAWKEKLLATDFPQA